MLDQKRKATDKMTRAARQCAGESQLGSPCCVIRSLSGHAGVPQLYLKATPLHMALSVLQQKGFHSTQCQGVWILFHYCLQGTGTAGFRHFWGDVAGHSQSFD